MTKRKRDIFTVIESINNWFEASEPTTNTFEGPEGDTGCLGTIGTSSDHLTTNGWDAEGAGSDNDSEPWTEAAQVAPNHTHEGTGLRPRSEVAASSSPSPKVSPPLTAETGCIPGPEDRQRGCNREGVQATGYHPDAVGESTSEITGPSIEPGEERDLPINAFWRVLADAGYDVW